MGIGSYCWVPGGYVVLRILNTLHVVGSDVIVSVKAYVYIFALLYASFANRAVVRNYCACSSAKTIICERCCEQE
jgi:hypothetical protein